MQIIQTKNALLSTRNYPSKRVSSPLGDSSLFGKYHHCETNFVCFFVLQISSMKRKRRKSCGNNILPWRDNLLFFLNNLCFLFCIIHCLCLCCTHLSLCDLSFNTFLFLLVHWSNWVVSAHWRRVVSPARSS